MAPIAGLELGCRALFVYDQVSSRLVLTLKYQRAIWLFSWLASQLVAVMPTSQIDCLTWIPAAQANRRKRGYDQAELLAKAVARQTGIAAKALLQRQSDLPQGRRDRQGRLLGPALLPRQPSQNPGGVVLVDDVITTGTSLRCAAEVLQRQGITQIGAIAVAASVFPSARGLRLI